MTRTMYDAVDAREIPPTAQLAAGYVSGEYAWPLASWERFPPAARVSIDVFAAEPSADVLDVENGDATVQDAPLWTARHNDAHGYPGIIYCARNTLTPLFNAMATAGLHVKADFRLGIATLDGTRTVADMTGVTFVQYLNTPGYDLSIVYDDAWKPTSPVLTRKPLTPPTADEYRAVQGDTWDSIATAHHLTGQQLYDYNVSAAGGRPPGTRALLRQRGINTLYPNELVMIP